MITVFTAETQPTQMYRLSEYEFYDTHIVYTSGKNLENLSMQVNSFKMPQTW